MIDILFITYIIYLIHLADTTSAHKADTTNPENHISPQDPNILNLMVSHYDCKTKQFKSIQLTKC